MGLPKRFDPRRTTIGRDRFAAALETVPAPPYADAVTEALRERTVESLRAITRIMPRAEAMSYRADDLSARAVNRMQIANDFVGAPNTVLDIGCARGENLIAQSQIRPCRRIGLDISDRLFAADCEFVKAPVEDMPLDSNSVDLATSFNAFEHFDDPEAALSEILRVLKPGGVLYAEFGPPWNAAYGAHLKNRIALPFIQHLYSPDIVGSFLQSKAPYAGKNGWSVERFIALFTRHPDADCVAFKIATQTAHLWMVKRLPGDFDALAPVELASSALSVALRKRGNNRVATRLQLLRRLGGSHRLRHARRLKRRLLG